ncbi:hypothetical protein OTK49_02050 [Vibrio coralliirubri]|uniref:hypothetical protein n=1 Tax=Vibrio coralliirubri TaxID=1516159 RepID=UPI00228399B4|nr:hypothetical protein [Vibrio coralliirubri]MCY9861297.1 hypothetical protein [Vibrio coralliirubri]
MNVISQQTHTIVIEDIDGLAPVTVFLADLAENKGKVVIECGGKGWANTWSWMHDKTIAQWFAGLPASSIAANFGDFYRTEIDFSKFADYANSQAKQLFSHGKINEEQFDEFADLIESSKEFISEDLGEAWCKMNSDAIEEILGEPWHEVVPQKRNKEYSNMITIIKAAQFGVKKCNDEEAA